MTLPLPRAMLIDMDDTILSAYSKPDLAWLAVAHEFADELSPLLPRKRPRPSPPPEDSSGKPPRRTGG